MFFYVSVIAVMFVSDINKAKVHLYLLGNYVSSRIYFHPALRKIIFHVSDCDNIFMINCVFVDSFNSL